MTSATAHPKRRRHVVLALIFALVCLSPWLVLGVIELGDGPDEQRSRTELRDVARELFEP